MTSWDDVVSDITALDVDLDAVFATGLESLAVAPRASEDFGVNLAMLAVRLRVETLADLLDHPGVEKLLAARLDPEEVALMAGGVDEPARKPRGKR